MESHAFDALTRRVLRDASRRGAVRGAVGALLAALMAPVLQNVAFDAAAGKTRDGRVGAQLDKALRKCKSFSNKSKRKSCIKKA